MNAALERAVQAGPPPAVAATAHSLVWGDINFENILVTDDAQIAGLIDFEGCMSGDPLATLGYGYAVHGEDPFFQLMLQAALGLAPTQQDARVAWYALLRALRLARYAHFALPTGRPRDALVKIVPGMVPALALLGTATRRPC
jgi:aminoglycoside phosphotransferase (APT) family kinase protein